MRMTKQTRDLLKMVAVMWVVILLAVGCGRDSGGIYYVQGPKGDTGAQGSTGVAGSNGVDGAKGNTGVTGGVGNTGSQGIAGAPGTAGMSCSVTQTLEGAQIACTDGTTAFVASGTQVTPVQFCAPGYVATYPTMFPEYGLIIGGKMFGVYSANGGFLSPLPPGTYTSNGINASCTFTINADNSITN